MNRDEYIKQIKNKLTSKDWAKIKTAKQRKDCAHLYDSNAVDGIDYQECPITNKRMASITGRYIKTLPTTEEEYFHYFPELKVVPEGRKEVDRKAKQKLYVDDNGNHILNESGEPMTVVEVNIMRKMETMRKVDEDGLTGIQKAGMKTREAHMNNIDEYGMNGYQRIASNAIVKSNLTKIANGQVAEATLENNVFQRYERIIEDLLRNIKTDGCIPSNVILVRNNSKVDGYQIDHIYSLAEGFKNSVSPLLIGSVLNCQLLPWRENLAKSNNCHITLEELYLKSGYNEQISQNEYNQIITVLQDDLDNKVPHSTLSVLERAKCLDNYKSIRLFNQVVKLTKP